jgi:hypothetical protein
MTVSSTLPNFDYLTLLDWYLLACILFVSLVIVANAVVRQAISQPDGLSLFGRVQAGIGVAGVRCATFGCFAIG